MKLLGRKLLQPLRGLDAETDRWLDSWTSELSRATWKALSDVRQQFPNTFIDKEGIYRFRVATRQEQIEVDFSFPLGIAIINGLRND